MILAQFLAQSITRVPLNWGTVGFFLSADGLTEVAATPGPGDGFCSMDSTTWPAHFLTVGTLAG